MLKVGILTRYFDNFNYGGLLQSYALQKYIQDMGFDAKQICFVWATDTGTKQYIKKMLKRIIRMIFFHKHNILITKWQNRMKKFESMIPHTERIFVNEAIKECVDDFDIFVCGSDQIWNPDFSDLYYYGLGFVPLNKRKISYSASIAKNKLTQKEKERMYPYLKKLDYISIREFQLKDEISKDIQNDIEVVCDPTMLLKKHQWDEIKNNNNMMPYIFAYLLEDNKKHRDLIKKFAEKKKCKIIFCPYVFYAFSHIINNFDFGDIRLDDIDPAGFIGLVENAECVITDSFHASVFSIIYHTDFYVMERKKSQEDEDKMGSRLKSLLGKMYLEERMLKDDITVEEMMTIDSISESKWEIIDEQVEEYRKLSISFLEKALGEAGRHV